MVAVAETVVVVARVIAARVIAARVIEETARGKRPALLMVMPTRRKTGISSSGVGAYMGCTLPRRPHPKRTMLRHLVPRCC